MKQTGQSLWSVCWNGLPCGGESRLHAQLLPLLAELPQHFQLPHAQDKEVHPLVSYRRDKNVHSVQYGSDSRDRSKANKRVNHAIAPGLLAEPSLACASPQHLLDPLHT